LIPGAPFALAVLIDSPGANFSYICTMKQFVLFAVDSYTHNSRKFTATGKTAKLAALASSDLLRGWLSPLSSAAYVYDSGGRFLGLVSK